MYFSYPNLVLTCLYMDIKFNTPTLLYAAQMDETLKWLEDNFKINFFSFSRRFSNSMPFSISTNRAWHIKYKEEYENFDTFMDIEKVKKYKKIYVWDSKGFRDKKEQKMHDERTQVFSIPPGISLINETNNFIDTYSFSTSMIFQDRINVLLNEFQQLFNFGIEFTKGINSLINEYTKSNLICIDKRLIKPIISKSVSEMGSDINHPDSNLVSQNILSDKQRICIYCSAQGLSSEQTGRIIGISKRTVESILNGCILKFGCINKYQLVYLATKYGFIQDELISPLVKDKTKSELLTISL